MFQRTRAKTIRVKTMDIVSKLADQRKKLFAVTVSVPVTSEVAVTRVSKNTRIERFYCVLHLLRHPFYLFITTLFAYTRGIKVQMQIGCQQGRT